MPGKFAIVMLVGYSWLTSARNNSLEAIAKKEGWDVQNMLDTPTYRDLHHGFTSSLQIYHVKGRGPHCQSYLFSTPIACMHLPQTLTSFVLKSLLK